MTGYPAKEYLEQLNKIENKLDQKTHKLSKNEQIQALGLLNDMNFPESIRLEQKAIAIKIAENLMSHPQFARLINDLVKNGTDITAAQTIEIYNYLKDEYCKQALNEKIILSTSEGYGSFYANKKNLETADAKNLQIYKDLGMDNNHSVIHFNIYEVILNKSKYTGASFGVIYHELSHAYQAKMADNYLALKPTDKEKIENFITNNYKAIQQLNPNDPRLKEADEYLAGKMSALNQISYNEKRWRKNVFELESQIMSEIFSDAIISKLDVSEKTKDNLDKKAAFSQPIDLNGMSYWSFSNDLKRIAEQIDYTKDNQGSLEGMPQLKSYKIKHNEPTQR